MFFAHLVNVVPDLLLCLSSLLRVLLSYLVQLLHQRLLLSFNLVFFQLVVPEHFFDFVLLHPTYVL